MTAFDSLGFDPGGLYPEPEYPLRCQHCYHSVRLLPNGYWEDRRGFMRCAKGVDHKPMPSIGRPGERRDETGSE